jgi:hypothetical protein
VISIPPASMKRIKTKIRSSLRYYPIPIKIKLKKLPTIFYGDGYSLIEMMSQTLELYKLVSDTKQMKELSEYFFIRTTIYFYGRYSVKNHRRTKELTKKITLVSFFRDYINIFNGKMGFESMKNRNKKLRRKYG